MATTKPRASENLQRASGQEGDRRVTPGLHPTPIKIAPLSDTGKPSAEATTNPSNVTAAESDGICRTAKASAEAFVALINQGIECWYQAGRMLISWRRLEPDCYRLITVANPWLSVATLEMFERIGDKSLHPKVLLLPPMLAERASRLTYAEQAKLVNKPMLDIRKQLQESKHYTRSERHQTATKLSDKLPTVGHFRLTFENGKVTAQQIDARNLWGVPVVLDGDNSCIVQLLRP